MALHHLALSASAVFSHATTPPLPPPRPAVADAASTAKQVEGAPQPSLRASGFAALNSSHAASIAVAPSAAPISSAVGAPSALGHNFGVARLSGGVHEVVFQTPHADRAPPATQPQTAAVVAGTQVASAVPDCSSRSDDVHAPPVSGGSSSPVPVDLSPIPLRSRCA